MLVLANLVEAIMHVASQSVIYGLTNQYTHARFQKWAPLFINFEQIYCNNNNNNNNNNNKNNGILLKNVSVIHKCVDLFFDDHVDK